MIIIFCPANQELGLRVIDYAFEWDVTGCVFRSKSTDNRNNGEKEEEESEKVNEKKKSRSRLHVSYLLLRHSTLVAPMSSCCLRTDPIHARFLVYYVFPCQLFSREFEFASCFSFSFSFPQKLSHKSSIFFSQAEYLLVVYYTISHIPLSKTEKIDFWCEIEKKAKTIQGTSDKSTPKSSPYACQTRPNPHN